MGKAERLFFDTYLLCFAGLAASRACISLCILVICAFIGSAQVAQATGPANNRTILTFVRHYEAQGNYNSYYVGIRTAPPKPLTQMTVGAVMAWQAGLINTRSTATGGYQIIKTTLAKLVKKHRIDRKALFDPTMQDRLGALLIANCQDRNNTPVFANCLASIWPALPRVSGPNQGRSRYHDIAGNKALTTPKNLLAMLEGQPFNLRTLAPCRSNSASLTTNETAPCLKTSRASANHRSERWKTASSIPVISALPALRRCIMAAHAMWPTATATRMNS